jgi:hypothetical protein
MDTDRLIQFQSGGKMETVRSALSASAAPSASMDDWLAVQDFIMTNELHWNSRGHKFSLGDMRSRECWQEWKRLREGNTEYSSFIRDMVRMNVENYDGDWLEFKTLVQAGALVKRK